MGERVRVIHDGEGRLVAVKTPPPDDPHRTRREATVLDGVHHPGVVEILDHHDTPDGLELHTRWVGSRTAADLPQPLSPDRAAGLVLAVAATLADLHRVGIVHGHLDASHVVLDPHGRPVLCGFGDARRMGADTPHDGPDAEGPRPSTDVAGLGELLADLLTDPMGIPTERHRWGSVPSLGRGRRRADERRALLAVADHATNPDPTCRPGLRSFVDAVRAAAPAALLGGPDDPPEPCAQAEVAADAEQSAIGATTAGASTTDPLLALLGDEPVVIHAPVAAGPIGRDADLYDDLARLRPADAPDPAERHRPRWLGATVMITGLALAGFIGVSTVAGDQTTTTTDSTMAARPEPTTAENPAPSPRPAPAAGPTPIVTTATGSAASPPGDPPVVEHAGARYQVGQGGDLVAVGDWRCTGTPAPALYRPATGSVFVFDGWPRPGTSRDAIPFTTTPDGTGLRADPNSTDGCPALVVTRGDTPILVLGPEDLR